MGVIMPQKKRSGTQEWADRNINFCTGCSNNCRYCYAKGMGTRLGWATDKDWPNMQIRDRDVKKKRKNYGELLMMPSSHDITQEILGETLIVLGKLLEAGNEVLVVSKPDPFCIKAICKQSADYKAQIIFRYTIGAMDNALLSVWEPGAPTFEERMESLIYAYDNGFTTSVSIEPMVDAGNVTELVATVLPYVTETIWIGKMNHLGRIKIDSDEIAAAVDRVRKTQTDERILAIYEALKGNPQIRWKDSIRKIVTRR